MLFLNCVMEMYSSGCPLSTWSELMGGAWSAGLLDGLALISGVDEREGWSNDEHW